MNNLKNRISKAFTLAEIIIVMGIIGVVAVLTVTNARGTTDEAVKIATLRKSADVIEAAFEQAALENGGSIRAWSADGNSTPTANVIWTTVKPYLKLKKDCGTSSGCWKAEEQLAIDKTSSGYNINSDSTYGKGILANGASIAVANYIFGQGSTFGSDGMILSLNIDVDGPNKGLNRFGDDIFAFDVYNTGYLTPAASRGHSLDDFSAEDDCYGIFGVYCTAWAMKFGNQDYLKDCRNELQWNADAEGFHTSCKD